jgi:magnesium transporter
VFFLSKILEEEKLVEEISNAIEEGDIESVRKIIDSIDPAMLADILNGMERDDRIKIIPYIDLLKLGRYVNKLDDEALREIELYKGVNEILELIYWLPVDEAVDLVQRLSPRIVNKILKMISRKRARELAELLRYPPESVGGVMTTRIPVFKTGSRVGDVLAEYVKKNMIGYYDRHDYIYVVDETGRLIGWIDVKTLLTVDRDKIIDTVISKPPVVLNPEMDREEAARIAFKYDLVEVPVVDSRGRLLGIVTIDDLMDIAINELSEDLVKLGGFMEAIRSSYAGSTVMDLVKRRVPPILVLYLLDSITGGIIASFKDLIQRIAVLASFLTMLADNSGNIGSQASSIVIRGLAIGDISLSDIYRVLKKEVMVTLTMSVFLLPVAFMIAFTITAISYHSYLLGSIIGVTVSISLLASILVADLIGATLPIILAKLKLDPASASAPLITTLGDIVSAILYFVIASYLISSYTLPA